MRKRHGPQRVRDIAPSKGERLVKRIHRGHKPANVLPFRARAVKVVRMFNALQENGWQFTFKVEAMSPGGWPYKAEGATAEEAFLKAFGVWEENLRELIPKIPAIVSGAPAAEVAPAAAAPEVAPKAPKARTNRKTRIGELLRMFGPQIAAPRINQPSGQSSDDGKRIYRRLYMRQYRANRIPKRAARPRMVFAA